MSLAAPASFDRPFDDNGRVTIDSGNDEVVYRRRRLDGLGRAGLAGSDTIRGLGGSDLLCGPGRDRLYGGPGRDVVKQ